MIIKSPSKRVSQLDLKFLDLKFMPIDQSFNSRTDPLPRLNESSIDPSKLSRFNTNSKYQSKHDITGCQKGSISNNKKAYSKADEYTRDITNQNCAESILAENMDLNTERMLNYLSADTQSIYKEFGSRAPRCSKPEKKKYINKQKHSAEYDKQDSIDRQIYKYEQQVKNYQKQNQLIHGQITRIYSDKKKDKNLQVKNVRNMRIFQQNHKSSPSDNYGIQQYYAEATQSFRYQSQDKQINKLKKGFFDKFKSTSQKLEKQLKNMSVEQDQTKQRKQHKHTLSECKSLRLNSTDSHINQKIHSKVNQHKLSKNQKDSIKDQGIKFPRLIQQKYDRFYEQLYKGKRDKVILTQKQKQLISKDNQSIQTLQQLKKKMINNNFDKNFEAFLLQKKIRVPQFIKNLR